MMLVTKGADQKDTTQLPNIGNLELICSKSLD